MPSVEYGRRRERSPWTDADPQPFGGYGRGREGKIDLVSGRVHRNRTRLT